MDYTQEMFKLLVWGTDYESVPFEHVWPKPRPRYEHLYKKLVDSSYRMSR